MGGCGGSDGHGHGPVFYGRIFVGLEGETDEWAREFSQHPLRPSSSPPPGSSGWLADWDTSTIPLGGNREESEGHSYQPVHPISITKWCTSGSVSFALHSFSIHRKQPSTSNEVATVPPIKGSEETHFLPLARTITLTRGRLVGLIGEHRVTPSLGVLARAESCGW